MNKIKKNYIKLILLIVTTVFFTLLISNIIKNIQRNKLNNSYLSNYVVNGYYKDLPSILTEISNKQFLYLTYRGDKNIYSFEKDLRKILKKNDLVDSVIEIDCTNEITEKKEVSNLNDVLKINTKENIKLPAIIYYKNSKPEDYIDSKDGILKIDKFSQLLEKWEIAND